MSAFFLHEQDRVELIRGEIVEMSPIGSRHLAFAGTLNQLLGARLLGRAFVWMQSPLVLAEDIELQPDIVVLRRRPVPYKDRAAGAEDALLAVEVADSSLAYDRTTKMRLYAAAQPSDLRREPLPVSAMRAAAAINRAFARTMRRARCPRGGRRALERPRSR